MAQYYFTLALRSLKRNMALTVLMIAAIAVGIGASMTTLTIFRAMSGDPIPRKSHQLFVPQIDAWGPDKPDIQSDDKLMTTLTYTDVSFLMTSHIASRQSPMYAVTLPLRPANASIKPYKTLARAASTDFFSMFDVPFEYGSAWLAADDEARAAVVVLTRKMNDKLFGGANSIGKTVDLDNEAYKVIGVADVWQPTPRFFDLDNRKFGDAEEMYIPFQRAIDKRMTVAGSTSCWDDMPTGFDSFLRSSCVWLSFWVELPSLSAVQDYRRFLHNYADEQRRVGRFNWPTRTQLRDVNEWLSYRHVVPSEVRVLVLVSFGFLSVCLINAMGLMLAKITGRAPDIGVRRALGASRAAIFSQCLMESAVIGLIGGIAGLALTSLGLLAMRSILSKQFVAVTHLDSIDVVLAVAIAIGATMLAGLYPTWRAAQVQPAWQLKTQ